MTVQILEDTHAVLSLRKLCEEHGHSYEWAGGQKPQLTKNGKMVLCNTENFVPIVVQGLSTGSSSSSASSSSTSSPQDTSDGISPSPAIQRSDDTHTQASRNRGEPTKTRTTVKHRVIECDISQSGYRSSQKILKMQKCQHEGTHPHTLLKIQIRNVLLKWSQRSTVLKLISRKTEIAKSARQPRLRGALAGSFR